MSPHTRIGSSYGHPYPSSSANATSVAAAPEMSATTQGRARNSKAKERARTKPIRAAAHRAQRAHLKGSFGLGFLMHPRQFVIPRSIRRVLAYSASEHTALDTMHEDERIVHARDPRRSTPADTIDETPDISLPSGRVLVIAVSRSPAALPKLHNDARHVVAADAACGLGIIREAVVENLLADLGQRR